MRIKALILSIIFFGLSFSKAEAQIIRIDLRGLVSDSSFSNYQPIEIFHGQILAPVGESREFFTGPYSIQIHAEKASPDTYAIGVSFFGLGPSYHSLDYKIKLTVGDDIFVPPLPVKNDASVKYFIKIIDDTSKIISSEPPMSDSTAWGISETVHYRTHWLKGSLADFMWNLKMAYLERIYDGFRKTFTVSSFYKIDYIFHPEPNADVYMKPGQHYSIQPRKMWIDMLYGHEVDGVTPRAAAELLLYKQWGYAPRWMVTGFAGYYFDNFLQLRKYADRFTAGQLDSLLTNEDWVDSDTGRVVTGALARWLVDSDLLSKFMKLYKESGPLDYEKKFGEIYGQDFKGALGDFINGVSSYKPNTGELAYYASIHMELGDYDTAREYLEEIDSGGGEEAERLRPTLVKCLYWLGDYEAASKTLGPNPFGPNCESDILRMILQVAAGRFQPFLAFRDRAQMHCSEAVLNLTSYLLDEGLTSGADSTLLKIDEKDKNRPEYLIESARLKLQKGQRADSLLAMAAAIALNRAQSMPHDPANYLVAGQALSIMGNYDRAMENLETSYFLESRPYFLGQVLLEFGKLYDLKGERARAREFYNTVISIDAGAYQKLLAKKYLEKKYEVLGVAKGQ